MDKRIYNFSAGPAILPEEVLKKAQEAGKIRHIGNSIAMSLDHNVVPYTSSPRVCDGPASSPCTWL